MKLTLAVPVAVGLSVALLAGCTPAVMEGPEPEPRKDLELSIGALLPDTGTLAALGPSTRAAFQLAADDIADAALPITVTTEIRDAGDSTSDTGLNNANGLIEGGVGAVVGPLSDNVSKKVIAPIVEAGIPMISPANTAPDFTTYDDDDLYWRMVGPCSFEGDALAQQIADSGARTAAVLTQTEACGEGLEQELVNGLERRDVEIVASASLDDGGTVDAAVAAFTPETPDAVAVVTSQAKSTLAPLLAAGFTGDQLYFLGLPPGDYSADVPAGALQGATATLPGPDIPSLDDFTDRLLDIDPALVEFSYAAETYDAVILLALAALAANDTTGDAIVAQLQAVSGGDGEGEACGTFAECGELIVAGTAIDYDGVSGPITFDEAGDPTGAVIGVFTAGRDNVFARVD